MEGGCVFIAIVMVKLQAFQRTGTEPGCFVVGMQSHLCRGRVG